MILKVFENFVKIFLVVKKFIYGRFVYIYEFSLKKVKILVFLESWILCFRLI